MQFILFGFWNWKKEIVSIKRRKKKAVQQFQIGWNIIVFKRKWTMRFNWWLRFVYPTMAHGFLIIFFNSKNIRFHYEKLKQKRNKTKITVQITCAYSHIVTHVHHTLFSIFVYSIYNFVQFFSLLIQQTKWSPFYCCCFFFSLCFFDRCFHSHLPYEFHGHYLDTFIILFNQLVFDVWILFYAFSGHLNGILFFISYLHAKRDLTHTFIMLNFQCHSLRLSSSNFISISKTQILNFFL